MLLKDRIIKSNHPRSVFVTEADMPVDTFVLIPVGFHTKFLVFSIPSGSPCRGKNQNDGTVLTFHHSSEKTTVTISPPKTTPPEADLNLPNNASAVEDFRVWSAPFIFSADYLNS